MSSASMGSGVGGNVGGPLQPTILELQQTAYVIVAADLLGISKDSMQRAISDIDRDGYLHYRASANRPNLVGPLERLRIALATEIVINESWKTFHNDLVGLLPADLQATYLAQMLLPLTERSPEFIALDNVLTLTAMALAWSEVASAPLDPASPAATALQISQMLPYVALQGEITTANIVFAAALGFLNDVGPNYPPFDALTNYLTQAGFALDEMKDIFNAIQTIGFANIIAAGTDPDIEAALERIDPRIAALATNLASMNISLNSTFISNDLLLISPTLNAMTLVAAALALNTISPTLFLGSAIATLGIKSNDSAAGFIGEGFDTFIQTLATGIASTLLQGTDPGTQRFMTNLILISLIASAASTAYVVMNGLGEIPGADPSTQLDANLFTVDVLMELINNAGFLQVIFQQIASSFAVDATTRDVLVNILTLTSLIAIVLAANNSGMRDVTNLLESMQGQLLPTLTMLEAYVSEAIESGTINGTLSQGLAIVLQQGTIALKNGDYAGFLNIVYEAFGLIGITPDILRSDFNNINNFVTLLAETLIMGLAEQSSNLTGLSNAA